MLIRLFVTVFLALFLISNAEAPDDPIGGDTIPLAVENGSQDKVQQPDHSVSLAGSAEAELHRIREEAADQREKDDLAAQQSMAKSNDEIVTISWFQLALAAIGSVLVFLSLGAAFYSNWLARESVRITQDTAKRELRAYVFNDGVDWLGEMLDGHLQRFMFKIFWRNCGVTPAYECDVAIWKRVIKSSDEITDTTFLVPDHLKALPTGYYLGPGTRNTAREWVNVADLLLVQRGKARAFIICKISYLDAFKAARFTQICFEIHVRIPEQDIFVPGKDHFELEMVGSGSSTEPLE
jgi:hypothetical protein